MSSDDSTKPKDFIRAIVAEDVAKKKNGGQVATRFPPEPNGCLHIGHAKSIVLNFGIAKENEGGICNLRFDDTNPTTEETQHVESIVEDVRWLGYDWGDRIHFTSDYFDQLFEFAVRLIEKGKAFVDDQSAEEIRANNGSLTQPGRNSPFRDRSVEENLDLFARMKAGEFDAGRKTLRAKIDMSSSVLTLRDPIMYRIQKSHHHRTGEDWSIYPMYDFAHGQSDAIEGITHSICTLEFQDHRPLYDWYIQELGLEPAPRQIEFARLNLTYTVMSKRMLRRLVDEGHVDGWDDPRLPTLRGLRRRGYTPDSIRSFCEGIGVAKRDNMIELARLEHSIRHDLNLRAKRVMGVLRPLKLVIENMPEGEVDELDAINNPEDDSAGTRKVPFSRELYIERDDFMEDPPKKFFRLAPGREVRLRYAYFVTCTEVVKDVDGEVVELRCTYDPATRGGDAPDGRKVKGTLHWVSVHHAIDAEVRLYDTLFSVEDPTRTLPGQDFTDNLNPSSLEVLRKVKVEPSMAGAVPGSVCQFERQGYFCVDPDSDEHRLVFNRTVTLRDTWAKVAKKEKR
ncbi:MAG: glutamine--tRNA ligase/YqeY domain fusion protein [Deltaproteobacteria bacterium]|nr:glutamine--tRNA ligase/YqeY domain fusion protein [Deltaproteobacteria bacterium]MBW2697680.1 glutamine--tRNA ligase/YqeY domain fusion protein [Deltaproteobacteria bacterium]